MPASFKTPWTDMPEVAGLKRRYRYRHNGLHFERRIEWKHADGSKHPESWTPYAGVPRPADELLIVAA